MTENLINICKDIVQIQDYKYSEDYLEQEDRTKTAEPKLEIKKLTNNTVDDSEFDCYRGVAQPSYDVENQLLPVVCKGKFLRSQWQFWVRKEDEVLKKKQEQRSASKQKRSKSNKRSKNDKSKDKTNAEVPASVTKNKDPAKDYLEILSPLGKISTLEEFFNYYVFMKKPDQVEDKSNLFFFKVGKTPVWEECPQGGVVILPIENSNKNKLNIIWEKMLFAMLAEKLNYTSTQEESEWSLCSSMLAPDANQSSFDISKVLNQTNISCSVPQSAPGSVHGISLTIKKDQSYLKLWLEDMTNEQSKIRVCNSLRDILDLDPYTTTVYSKKHSDSIKDQSTLKHAEGFKFLVNEVPMDVIRAELNKPVENKQRTRKSISFENIKSANDSNTSFNPDATPFDKEKTLAELNNNDQNQDRKVKFDEPHQVSFHGSTKHSFKRNKTPVANKQQRNSLNPFSGAQNVENFHQKHKQRKSFTQHESGSQEPKRQAVKNYYNKKPKIKNSSNGLDNSMSSASHRIVFYNPRAL